MNKFFLNGKKNIENTMIKAYVRFCLNLKNIYFFIAIIT